MENYFHREFSPVEHDQDMWVDNNDYVGEHDGDDGVINKNMAGVPSHLEENWRQLGRHVKTPIFEEKMRMSRRMEKH